MHLIQLRLPRSESQIRQLRLKTMPPEKEVVVNKEVVEEEEVVVAYNKSSRQRKQVVDILRALATCLR